jgi:hypothetical protein
VAAVPPPDSTASEATPAGTAPRSVHPDGLNWAEACGAGCKGADRSSGASGEDAGGSGVGGGVTAAGFTVVPQPVQNWSSDSRGIPQSVQKAIYAAPATRAATVVSTTRP